MTNENHTSNRASPAAGVWARAWAQRDSLRARLILIAVVAVLLGTTVVGWLNLLSARQVMRREKLANLNLVADLKKSELENWLAERQGDVGLLAGNLFLRQAVAAGDPQARRLLSDILDATRQHFDAYSELLILSVPQGTLLVSTEPGRAGEALHEQEYYLETVAAGQPHIGAAFLAPASGRVTLAFSEVILAPGEASGNAPVGVLVAFVDVEGILGPLVRQRQGMGATGEMLLVERSGLTLLNLRHLSNVPLAYRIQARPAVLAAAGQEGLIEALDYRDVPVIAAYRHLPSVGWGLVAKQDEAEVFADIVELRNRALKWGVLAAGITALLVLLATRVLTRPLWRLAEAARRIAGGDYSVRVQPGSGQEVRDLAQAFNTMVGQLSQTRDELTRSNQELFSFAYVVSHDLKAPLRGIASLSEWLVEDLEGKLESEHVERLGLLRERVQRMDALINGLLDYSRIGRARNPEVAVAVETLLVRVIDSISPPEGILISVTTKMPWLQTDELHLIQVFQNLIGNAVNYHPGPQGNIEISSRDQGDFWEFAVRDDGLGIEPRHHERIFQMFQSLQTNQDVDSTGIGLALVRKIVEEHDGKVWVESQGVHGQGSIFRFTWPKTK